LHAQTSLNVLKINIKYEEIVGKFPYEKNQNTLATKKSNPTGTTFEFIFYQ